MICHIFFLCGSRLGEDMRFWILKHWIRSWVILLSFFKSLLAVLFLSLFLLIYLIFFWGFSPDFT